MRFLLTILLVTVFFSPSLGAAQDALYGFTYQQQAIPPQCISQMVKENEVGLGVMSINLNSCFRLFHLGNKSLPYKILPKAHAVGFKNGNSSFLYRVLGQTANQTFVLQTVQNSGGSGIFSTILFAKIVQEPLFYIKDNKLAQAQLTTLKITGLLPAGDRNTNGIVVEKIKGNTLSGYRITGKTCPTCSGQKQPFSWSVESQS